MESLPITTPDFTSLESDLKAYLKSRPELTDYDFDGSVLSNLVGVLAYNSTMNAFYLNQVANEAFLETASRRDNVVLNAQDLGYQVRTAASSFATIRLALTENPTTSRTSIVLPSQIAVFTSNVNDKTFTFRALSDITMPKVNGVFVADFNIYEGKQFAATVPITQSILDNGYTIPVDQVDSQTITITVGGYTFTRQDNIVAGLDGNSKVYFTRELNGKTVIEFGDGVIGFQPALNSSMVITYLKTNGDLANGVGTFTMTGSYPGTTASLSVLSAASGGGLPESINSIKFYAPKWFETQGRAVTSDDYKVVIHKLFSSIVDDAIAWGGEDNDPPIYGKVFLSLKPFGGFYLTDSQKSTIITALKKYNVVTISPVIVDPDYTYVDISGSFEYLGSDTLYSQSSLETIVNNAIRSYADTELGKFVVPIRYSRIANVVLGADPSVQTTKFTYVLSKHFTPSIGGYNDISVKFGNPISKETFKSSRFVFNSFQMCYFVDNGDGTVNISDFTTGVANVLKSDAGTIDYTTGDVNIPRVYIVDVDRTLTESTGTIYMQFDAESADVDINTNQRSILVIDNISMTSVKV